MRMKLKLDSNLLWCWRLLGQHNQLLSDGHRSLDEFQYAHLVLISDS